MYKGNVNRLNQRKDLEKMLAPHELKKAVFQRAMRGYNPAEVDEYISYLLKNYVDLYRLNSELEKKLEIIIARNNELSRDSDTVRTALLDAQRAASKIVGEAKEEAQLIVHSSKRSCDNILNEFRAHIAEEREKLLALQNEMSAFKERIYSELQAEIETVVEMTEHADWSGLDIDDEIYTRRIVTDIKSDVASVMNERVHDEDTGSYGGPDPEIFDAANKDEKISASAVSSESASVSEVPDAPTDAPDATKIFDAAALTPEALEVPAASRIDEEIAAEPTPKKSESNLSAGSGITEEYDLVLEKFAEEMAAEAVEASAETEENK